MTSTSNGVWEMTVEVTRRGVDRAEVRRALAFLVDPDATHEVRGLPSGRSRAVRGSGLDAAVDAVESLSDDRGVYVTLNPVRPDLGDRAARVGDVLCRRRLLVDCDRVKGEADGDLCSTEAEKAAARALAESVLADLTSRGWPRPLVIDSGNGWHLVYAIDLPNDPLARQLVSRCLKALRAAHDAPGAGAAIDVKVCDAPRVTKVPGTWVRKGPDTPERPHRVARLVAAPAVFTPVDVELLRELAGVGVAGPEGPAADPVWEIPIVVNGNVAARADAYVRKALAAECGRVAVAPAGERNDTLNAAAFSLGQLVHLGTHTRAEVEAALAFAARRAGLSDHEVGPTIRSGMDAGGAKPRQPLPAAHRDGRHGAAAEPGDARNPDATTGHSGRLYAFPLIVRGSAVTPKKVDWLWRDRVPYGFLTLFAGRTGVGKSFVTLDLMARLSAGGEVPAGAGEVFDPPGASLMISEDSHDFVLAPRLIEAGADMDLVSFMGWEAMAAFTLSDTVMLDDAFEAAGRPRLVVIDPPTNFLGAKDEHRNAEVRGVLMLCSKWAMEHGAAFVMITHTNKGTKKDIAALDRVIGSIAWASTSRVAHILAPDPEAPGRGLFLPLKTNVGELPKGLTYAIRRTDDLARVEWLGAADLDADQALNADRRSPRAESAAEWLTARLRERREWPSEDLFDAAGRAGISRNAVFEAKKVLHLPKADKRPGGWVWWVPPGWEPPAAEEVG